MTDHPKPGAEERKKPVCITGEHQALKEHGLDLRLRQLDASEGTSDASPAEPVEPKRCGKLLGVSPRGDSVCGFPAGHPGLCHPAPPTEQEPQDFDGRDRQVRGAGIPDELGASPLPKFRRPGNEDGDDITGPPSKPSDPPQLDGERWPALICKSCGKISDGPIDHPMVCACAVDNGESFAIVEVVRASEAARYDDEAERLGIVKEEYRAEAEAQRKRADYTEQWYAERIERLTDLAKEHGIWDRVASILANGTAEATEPPTYAQLLNVAKSRAEKAEAQRDEQRASYVNAAAVAGDLRAQRDAAQAALREIADDDFEYIVGEAGDFSVEDQLRATAKAALRSALDTDEA